MARLTSETISPQFNILLCPYMALIGLDSLGRGFSYSYQRSISEGHIGLLLESINEEFAVGIYVCT